MITWIDEMYVNRIRCWISSQKLLLAFVEYCRPFLLINHTDSWPIRKVFDKLNVVADIRNILIELR